MKIVIDIPEEMYKEYKQYVILNNDLGYEKLGHLYELVGDGIPLPEGHGCLIDANELKKEVSSWGMNDYEPSDFIDAINNAQIIIEADNSKSE